MRVVDFLKGKCPDDRFKTSFSNCWLSVFQLLAAGPPYGNCRARNWKMKICRYQKGKMPKVKVCFSLGIT